MGHLINPVAFRLNFFKSWEDTWFVKNIYYPEFLNGMLKFRNYLYFFLTNKKILKSGFFLSHFNIIKYNKIFLINIFLYHIDFEKLSYQSINKLYSKILKIRMKYIDYKKFDYKEILLKKENFRKCKFLLKNNTDFFFFLVFFYKIFYKKKQEKKKKMFKLLLNLNIFFKSNDFFLYYDLIFNKLNKKLTDKLFYSKNKQEQSKLNIIKENDLLRNKICEEKEYKLIQRYKDSIFFNFLKKKNIIFYLNKRLKYSYFDRVCLNVKFTLLEFVVYLLKKISFNFRLKYTEKVIKLSSLIFFINIFKYLKYKNLKKASVNYNFLLFFFSLLLKSFVINIKKNKIRNKVYYLFYTYLGYKFFFKELKIITFYLNGVFYILNKIKNIYYKFFFLSNKNITARWLCRYIGLRLKNNFNFFSVVGPIKRELYKLCKLPKKNKAKLNKFTKFIKNNLISQKFKFKTYIRGFLLIYIMEYNLYYVINNSYINNFYIYKNYKNNNNKKSKFIKFINTYIYIYINIFINFYWGLNLIKKFKLINEIISKVYNILSVNIENKVQAKLKSFSVTIFFLKNFFNFNYFKYLWIKLKKLNYRNLRNNYVIKYRSILVGYKLLFKGRFSRKQRASYIWHMRGKIPLNTLSIKLDYFFFTIPLKNSAISIKITLYKSPFYEKYKYLLSF